MDVQQCGKQGPHNAISEGVGSTVARDTTNQFCVEAMSYSYSRIKAQAGSPEARSRVCLCSSLSSLSFSVSCAAGGQEWRHCEQLNETRAPTRHQGQGESCSADAQDSDLKVQECMRICACVRTAGCSSGVCAHLCMCMRCRVVHAGFYVHLFFMHVYVHVCMCTGKYTCAAGWCMQVYVHLFFIHVCACVHVHSQVYVRMCACFLYAHVDCMWFGEFCLATRRPPCSYTHHVLACICFPLTDPLPRQRFRPCMSTCMCACLCMSVRMAACGLRAPPLRDMFMCELTFFHLFTQAIEHLPVLFAPMLLWGVPALPSCPVLLCLAVCPLCKLQCAGGPCNTQLHIACCTLALRAGFSHTSSCAVCAPTHAHEQAETGAHGCV